MVPRKGRVYTNEGIFPGRRVCTRVEQGLVWLAVANKDGSRKKGSGERPVDLKTFERLWRQTVPGGMTGSGRKTQRRLDK